MSESLKTGYDHNLLFKALTPLMEMDAVKTSSQPMSNAHWLTELFTSIVPSILFVCYEEEWCNFFAVSAKQAETDFLAAYRMTHGAYHDSINKNSC